VLLEVGAFHARTVSPTSTGSPSGNTYRPMNDRPSSLEPPTEEMAWFNADDGRQQLRSNPDGDGQRKQQGVDERPVQGDVDDEDGSGEETAATLTRSLENPRRPT